MTNTNEKNHDIVIVRLYDYGIYDFKLLGESIPEAIKRATDYYKECQSQAASNLLNYGHENAAFFKSYLEEYNNILAKGFEVMTYKKWIEIYKERLLSEPMVEITKETFHEMLDILSPMSYVTINNVEEFCMREFYTHTFTNQYAHDKLTDKYWCKLVDYTDQSTWLHELLRKG